MALQKPQSCTRLRVLFVEDDPADIDLLALALRKGGFDASHDVAETVEVFAAQIRTNRYDVILADYKLPNWNGMETVEVLRQEGLDIPVILVSGALGETDGGGMHQAGGGGLCIERSSDCACRIRYAVPCASTNCARSIGGRWKT